MAKTTKPLVIIVIAVILAGSTGLYLARRSATTSAEEPESTAPIQPTGGGRTRGPANAPVTLVEFGDYQCPSCGAYFPIVNEVLKRYPTQVRLEFHHYPLANIHQHAMTAALAAEAAGDQGKFWEMNDLIFENQERWSKMDNAEAEFLAFAGRIGLNVNQFMQSMRSPETQRRVLEDVTRARDAKLTGVPSFFVNGQRIMENPPNANEFSALIQTYIPK